MIGYLYLRGEEKLREVVSNYERVLSYFDVVRVNALLSVEELVDEVEKIVLDFINNKLVGGDVV